MRFSRAAVFILPLIASYAEAELASLACSATYIRPWILSSNADVAACRIATGYATSNFQVPGDPSLYDQFCASADCRVMLANTLAVKPPTGDCTVVDKVSNERVNFYEQIVGQFTVACNARTNTPSPVIYPMW